MAEQGVGAAVGSPDHALDEAATEAGEQYAAAVHCGAMPSGVLDLRRVPAGRTVGKLVPRTDLRSSLERYAAKVLAIVRHNRTQDPTHPASVMTLPRLLAQCAYHFRAKEWRELGVSLDVVPSVAAYAALCKQVDNTVHAVFASRDILTLHELQREVPLLLGGASGGGDWEALGTLHSVSQNPCAIVYFGARLPASLSVPDVTSSDVLAYMYAAGTGTRPGAKGAPAAPEATVRATLAGFAASVAAEKGWSAEHAAACVAHPEMLGVWMRRIAAVLEAVDTERTRIRSAAADGLRVAEAAAAAAPDGAAPPLRIGTRSDATLPEEVRLAAWVVRIVKAANESQTATQAAVAPTFHASPRLSGSLIRKVFLQPWTVAPADQALVTSSLRGLLHPAVDPAYGEREAAEAKGSDGSGSESGSDSSTGSSDTTETRSSDSSSAAEVRRKSLASRLEKRVDLKEKKLRRRFERRQEQRSCAETERVMADHRRRQTEREAYVSLGIATRPDVVATLRAALRSVPQAEWHAAETLAALEKAVVAAHTAPLHAVEAKVGPLPSLLLEAVQGLATGAGEGATRGKAKKTGGAEADSDGDDDGDSDSDEEEDNGQVAPRRQRVAAVLSVLREVVEECRDEGLLAGADLAELFQGEVVEVGGGDDEDEEGCDDDDDDDAAVAAEDDATTQAFFLRFLGYVETRVLSLLSRDAGKPCESFAALRLGCFTAFVAAAPGASCGDEDDDEDEGVDDEDEDAAAAAAPLAVLTPLFDSLLLKYLTGDAAGGCVRRRYADAKVAALLERRGGDGGGGDARRHRARTALRLPAEVNAALRGFLAGVLDKLVGGAALAGEAEEGDDAEGDVAAAAATGRDAVGAREMWLAWDLTCRAFPAFFHEGHGESVELFRRVLGEVADDAAAAAAGGDAAAPVAPLAPAAALLPLAPRCAASVCASGHARGLCYMPEGGTPALLPRRRFAAAEADELLSVRPSPPLVSRAVLGAGAGESAATLAALRRRVAAYLQSPEMPRLAEVKAHLGWDAALAPALGEVTAFLRAANIAHVTAGSYGTVACAAAAGEDAAAAGACRRLVTPSEVYVVAPASSAHASVDRVKELVEAGEGVEVAYCLLSHVAARTASTHGGSGASDLTLVCEAVRASFLAVEGEGTRCATVMHAALALPRDAGFYLTSAVLLPALVRSTPSAVSRLLNLAATRLRLPQRLALFNIVAASAAASAGQLLRAKLVEREQAPGQPQQQQQQQQQVVEAAATSATSAAAEPAQPSKPAAPSQAAAPAKKKAAAKPAALVPAAAAASPRAYVEELLQQEFGEGVELDAVGRQLLETNLSRLGRAIVRLASDLYSSDVHFVLELIQNADDNTYPATRAGAEVVPTLRLDVTGDAVVVSNNEVGFRPENIRALCDVGSSTKMGAEGYIGMKGIGFKSVFRVTASPEIHSSGFHIAFNVAAEAEGGKGSMGYISPTWLGDDGEQGHPDRSVVARKSGDDGGADGGYATQIVLPLLPDLRGSEGRSELIEKMEDVQPSLLLFLRKVRNLVVRDHVRGTVLDMVRRDLGRIAPSAEQAAAASTASSSSSSHADIVEVSVNKQPFKWLVKRGGYSTRGEVVRQDLRGDVATTELALAFPLDAPSSGGGDEREDMMVFAFLPLRTCGLKFVLQGDWAIPTSREDIDAGSPWNQWLRAKIPELFVSALDNFKACHAPEAQPAALSTFLTFVPEGAGVIPFFRPLVQGVRALLLGTPCMLTSAGGWALPSDVVVLPDTLAAPPCSLASVLAPEATLRAALDKVYLHPGVELSEKMARHLRVGRIGVAELVTLLEHKLGARDEEDGDGVSYRAWLRCWIHSVTACLDGRCGTPSSAAATPALFERLKRLRFVPLEGGGVGSVRDGAIFSAASAAAGAAGKTRAAEKEEEEAAPSPASASVLDPQDARYRPLTKGMRMLDAGMLEGAEPAVAAFFVSLGVRRLTPLDVVERFLLPRYRELSAAREGGGGLVAVAAAGDAGEGQVWEGAHGAAGTRVSVTAAFLHATVWFLAAHRGVLPDDARRKIAKVVLLHTNAGPVSPRETAVLFSSAYQAERRAGAAGAADGDSDSSSDDGAQHMEVDEDEPRAAYGPDRFHLRYTFSRAEGGTVSLRDRAKESGALSEKTTSEAAARNPAGFVVVSDGYLGASAAVAAAAAAAGEEGEARKRRRGESAWELADALVSLGVEWFYAPTVKRVWVSDYTKTSLWRDCAWPLASRSGEVLDRQCAPLEAALTKLVACFDQLGKKEKEKGEAKVRRGESFARMGEILSCLLCVAEEVNNAPHAAAAAQSDFVSSSDKKKKKQGGAAGLFATLGGNSAAAAGAKLPSSYTHMLRTLRWLPSSRYTLNTPPELLQRTPAATRLLGSSALHPLLPVLSDRRVAEAAALRTEVSAGDVVEALERQGTAAVSAGAAYGRSGYPASLSTMAAMYSFLREQHAAGGIAAECLATLRGGPVLFVPRTAARVNEVTGDTLGMFCRPSEVAWEDPVAELARPAAAGGAKLYSVDADQGLLGELEGVLASDRDAAAAACAAPVQMPCLAPHYAGRVASGESSAKGEKEAVRLFFSEVFGVRPRPGFADQVGFLRGLAARAGGSVGGVLTGGGGVGDEQSAEAKSPLRALHAVVYAAADVSGYAAACAAHWGEVLLRGAEAAGDFFPPASVGGTAAAARELRQMALFAAEGRSGVVAAAGGASLCVNDLPAALRETVSERLSADGGKAAAAAAAAGVSVLATPPGRASRRCALAGLTRLFGLRRLSEHTDTSVLPATISWDASHELFNLLRAALPYCQRYFIAATTGSSSAAADAAAADPAVTVGEALEAAGIRVAKRLDVQIKVGGGGGGSSSDRRGGVACESAGAPTLFAQQTLFVRAARVRDYSEVLTELFRGVGLEEAVAAATTALTFEDVIDFSTRVMLQAQLGMSGGGDDGAQELERYMQAKGVPHLPAETRAWTLANAPLRPVVGGEGGSSGGAGTAAAANTLFPATALNPNLCASTGKTAETDDAEADGRLGQSAAQALETQVVEAIRKEDDEEGVDTDAAASAEKAAAAAGLKRRGANNEGAAEAKRRRKEDDSDLLTPQERRERLEATMEQAAERVGGGGGGGGSGGVGGVRSQDLPAERRPHFAILRSWLHEGAAQACTLRREDVKEKLGIVFQSGTLMVKAHTPGTIAERQAEELPLGFHVLACNGVPVLSTAELKLQLPKSATVELILSPDTFPENAASHVLPPRAQHARGGGGGPAAAAPRDSAGVGGADDARTPVFDASGNRIGFVGRDGVFAASIEPAGGAAALLPPPLPPGPRPTHPSRDASAGGAAQRPQTHHERAARAPRSTFCYSCGASDHTSGECPQLSEAERSRLAAVARNPKELPLYGRRGDDDGAGAGAGAGGGGGTEAAAPQGGDAGVGDATEQAAAPPLGTKRKRDFGEYNLDFDGSGQHPHAVEDEYVPTDYGGCDEYGRRLQQIFEDEVGKGKGGKGGKGPSGDSFEHAFAGKGKGSFEGGGKGKGGKGKGKGKGGDGGAVFGGGGGGGGKGKGKGGKSGKGFFEDRDAHGGKGGAKGPESGGGGGGGKGGNELVEATAEQAKGALKGGRTEEEDDGFAKIGRWGEEFAYTHLSRRAGPMREYSWVNGGEETGASFDIIEWVTDASTGTVTEKYLEVKATVSDSKMYFEMSYRELQFAQAKGDHYSIVRVFSAGTPNARFIIINNPLAEVRRGNIRIRGTLVLTLLGQRVQGKMKVVRLRRSNPTDSTGLNVRKDLTVNSHNDVPGVEANGRAPPGWVITHVNKTPVESIADLKAVLDMGTLNVEVVLTEPAAAEAPQRHDRLLR